MAADTRRIEGFGQVSRRLDVAFRYLLLAATLVGIVTLAVLLLYVANDAFRPFTADPGWLLTYAVAFLLPSLAVAAWLTRRRYGAFVVGAAIVGLGVVSFLFSAGAGIVFVDIVPPLVWFSIVVALAVPFAVTVAVQRVDWRLPYRARVGIVAVVTLASLWVVPGAIQSLAIVPADGAMLLLTTSAPLAALLGGRAWSRWESRGAGLVAGAVAFLLPAVAMVGGPLVGVDPVSAVVLATFAVVPTLAYVAAVAVDRPADRLGLLLPAVVVGGALAGWVLVQSFGFAGPNSWVDWQFLTSAHSGTPENAGFYPAIGGSIVIMVVVAVISFPLGVGSAIYLEEYAPQNRFARIVDVNIANLAGVPSVVYGLLGLGVFVTYLGQPPGTAFVGGATLALLILPIVIIASREAIRSVPTSIRQASDGLGATRWQTTRNVVLPRAFPGIMTGTILALGRAIGETAPLIMIGAPNVFYSLPTGFSDRVGAMPLQIYAWASLYAGPQFYTRVVPAGVVVLLVVLLAMNSIAIALRNTYQNRG